MTALNYTDFADVDAVFVDAPETSTVEDGEYIAKIDVCRAELSKNQKRMLHWEFLVIGGTFDGKRLFLNHILETPANVGWCKSDLRRIGIDVDNPQFAFGKYICESTGMLIGRYIKVSVKNKLNTETNRNNTNVYFRGDSKVKGSAVANEAEVAAVQAGTTAPITTPAATGTPAAPASNNPWDAAA